MNKKLVSVLMVVVMLVAVLSTTVSANGGAEPKIPYAKVTNVTADDSLITAGAKPTAEISGNGTETVTVTFNAADLKYVDDDQPRLDDKIAAWIGINVKPDNTGVTGTDKEINAYSVEVTGGGTTVTPGVKDLPVNGLYLYNGVNEDKLTEAVKAGKENVTYTYDFKWYHKANEDGSQTLVSTQKINVVISVAGVKLLDEKGEEVWNKWIYEEVKADVKAPSTDDPADEPSTKPSTSDKDEEPKTGITATAIVATATVAMISLAGVAISKK